MAEIYTQTIQIHLNKLVKSSDDVPSLITEDLIVSLEAVAQELVGNSIIVEVSVK